MQCAVIEFARNVLGLKDANSSEFDENTAYPVIDLLPEQKEVEGKGGTMRLGNYQCNVETGSMAFKAYGEKIINERHRHRYELNNEYRQMLNDAGMIITGIYPDKNLAEIVEVRNHPWFTGVQFHPEFKSRPDRPHPLFREFIAAAISLQK